VNEMVIIFQSNFTVDVLSTQRGFKAIISLANARPPSFVATGTPLFWQCSFEPGTPDQLCGMTQDQTDQFDWTVFKGPTPSDPTGPDAAYDKEYYAFIEASEPRVMNDEARLFFPKFSTFSGDACVRFFYHMYGFHVNTIKLNLIEGGSSRVLWSKSNQIGNVWVNEAINVRLTQDSQLQIAASRGEAFSGDIAVDMLGVMSGHC